MSGQQPPTEVVSVLQDVLAGEHAAIYAYEVLGGRLRLGSTPQQRAAAAYRHHRRRRDELSARLRKDGATPVAAAPAYQLGIEVTGPDSARKLAVRVERRCTTLYARLVAVLGADGRQTAIEAMTWCATEQLSWGAGSSALPGVGSP